MAKGKIRADEVQQIGGGDISRNGALGSLTHNAEAFGRGKGYFCYLIEGLVREEAGESGYFKADATVYFSRNRRRGGLPIPSNGDLAAVASA